MQTLAERNNEVLLILEVLAVDSETVMQMLVRLSTWCYKATSGNILFYHTSGATAGEHGLRCRRDGHGLMCSVWVPGDVDGERFCSIASVGVDEGSGLV